MNQIGCVHWIWLILRLHSGPGNAKVRVHSSRNLCHWQLSFIKDAMHNRRCYYILRMLLKMTRLWVVQITTVVTSTEHDQNRRTSLVEQYLSDNLFSFALLRQSLHFLDVLFHFLCALERKIPPLSLHNNIRHCIDPINRLLTYQHLRLLQALALVCNKCLRFRLVNTCICGSFEQCLWRRGMFLLLQVLFVECCALCQLQTEECCLRE